MNRIGTGLLKQTMAARDNDKGNKSRRKDILSLLAHANSLEAEGQRITEEDILARTHKPIFGLVYLLNVFSEIPTFIIAGHETTRYFILYNWNWQILNHWHSVTMAWALYALSQNKEAQTKLREEVSELSTDNPSMDDLNGLQYLDAVVRETLRLYPAVGSIVREAVKDDCIPLSKPFTDVKGDLHNEIR